MQEGTYKGNGSHALYHATDRFSLSAPMNEGRNLVTDACVDGRPVVGRQIPLNQVPQTLLRLRICH